MASKFDINSFLKQSKDQQAKEIEKLTKEVIGKLPTLKKNLKMYGDTSDELYNLTKDELELMGTTYARAVRGGEISTPSSKRAYQNFVKSLRKYARANVRQLALQTASERMDSWLDHVNTASSTADSEYAKELFDSMTEEEKLGFTRSKFFMDSSYMYMVTEEDGKQYSIQTLKLELYLEEVRGHTTKHIYRNNIKQSEDALRKYKKKR